LSSTRYDQRVTDLGFFRWVGAGIAALFALVQGAAMAWDLLPLATRAALLRRVAHHADGAAQRLYAVSGYLMARADRMDAADREGVH